MNDLEFMIWIHHRLTEVYGENPNVDYMHKLRAVIGSIPVDQVSPNMGNLTITDLEVKRIKAQHPTPTKSAKPKDSL